MTEAVTRGHMPANRARHARQGLAVIAVFKFAKAAAMIAVGLAMLGLLRDSFADRVQDWLEPISLGQTHAFAATAATHALHVIDNAGPGRLSLLAVGAFLYAAVFLVEGVGLARGRRWAEFLTIGVTLSFLPFEIAAIVNRTTWPRVATLVINVAVVVYLVWQIRSSRGYETS